MDGARDASRGLTFHEDRRAVWRVTWTLALAFLLVSWLMQRDGASPWLLFAGVALLLAGIGVSALLAPSRPLARVDPDGLRVFAGKVGLGGRGDAGAFTIPWEAITRAAFEQRIAHPRRARTGHPMTVTALCFRLADTAPRPDGQRGFLERVSGRDGGMAVGEHFLWSRAERSIDLTAAPRGGFPKLTAAVARAAPRLGDASAGRRRGLGGPLAHALYDAGLALAVVATLLLWATGRATVVSGVARRLLALGGIEIM